MVQRKARPRERKERTEGRFCRICGKPVYSYEESEEIRTSRRTTHYMHKKCIEEEQGRRKNIS